MKSNPLELLETGTYPIDWPGHWSGGKWKKPGKNSEEKISLNPSRGNAVLVFRSSKEIVNEAVSDAASAFKKFREASFKDRVGIIKSFAAAMGDWRKALVRCQQLENGKPLWEAQADFDAAHRYIGWVAKNSENIRSCLLAPANLGFYQGEFRLHPVGVTLAYLPFSSPVTSFVFYLCGAMLAGCPLVIFTPAQSALCALLLSRMCEQLNLFAGVLNIVSGNYSEFNSALGNPEIQAIIYTGSKEHCDQLREDSRGGKKRQLILQSGGKNAALVHSTADLDKAVRCILLGACKSAGQLCSSTSRVFVFRSLLPEFRDKLFKAASNMSVGVTDKGQQPGPVMGPLYSRKSVEKFLRFQTMGHRDAMETILWGKELEVNHGGARGFFVSPGIHLMKSFDPSSSYQNNILFSPDLAIYTYDILKDPLEWINETEACQSVAFFGNPDILKDRSHLLYAPNLIVNAPTTELEATLPLAGRSQSGHHRYHGPGLALYLCYPQAFRHLEEDWSLISSWPLT